MSRAAARPHANGLGDTLPAGDAVIEFEAVDEGTAAADTAASPPLDGLRPASRLRAGVEVILVSGFPTQLVLGALLWLIGMRPWDASGALSLRYVVAVLLLDTVLLVALILLALNASGERARDLFVGRRPPLGETWLGLATIPAVIGGTALLMMLIRYLWPALHNVPTNPFEALIRSPLDAFILGAAAVVGGGIKEELQRAFILHRFGQSLGGARLGLALYSAAFGLGHAIQGWDVGIATGVLGLAWGSVFLWRRSSVAPVVSHAGFNAAQVIQFVVFGR